MDDSERGRAVRAATALARSLGLAVDQAAVVQSSNKLTLRLVPCDSVARVASAAEQVAAFEVAIAGGLAALGAPVAALDPRVERRPYERDGFVVTFWTYCAPPPTTGVPPAVYASALARLHAGMRELNTPAPHFLERVASARRLVEDRDLTPRLSGPDRELLATTMRELGPAVAASGAEQLLHGEPHPGNLLPTGSGPVFIDFETCCRGPVEFDVAHAPSEVAEHYPGLDVDLLRDCRTLMLAMVTSWRFDRDDRLPDGERLGFEWLELLRNAVRGRT